MIKFKEFLEEVKKPTGKLKDACWKGYTAIGTKEKNGKQVPNCIPEEVHEYLSESKVDVDGTTHKFIVDPAYDNYRTSQIGRAHV